MNGNDISAKLKINIDGVVNVTN